MKKLIWVVVFFIFSTLIVLAKQPPINIVFCINNKYVIFTCLTVNSILLNNTSQSEYNFYIVENNLTDKDKSFIKNFINKKKQNVEFIHIDNDKIPLFKEVKRCVSHIANITLARLLLPDILLKTIDKILYLDADLLVTTDLKELYSMNIEEEYVTAMAYDIFLYNFYQGIAKNTPDNYNGGVMLIDLKKWREENISEKCINFMKQNADRFNYTKGDNYHFWYGEQDVINIVLDKKIKTLEQKWNNLPIIYESENPTYYIPKMLENTQTWNGGIIHYAGPLKPWNFNSKKNKEMKLYLKYWTKSGLNRYKILYICYSIIQMYEEFFQKIINLNKEIF